MMTAKKVEKKVDPNLCAFVGGKNDGLKAIIGPNTKEIELLYVRPPSQWYYSFINDWRDDGNDVKEQLYVRILGTNTFLFYQQYKDDPRLIPYCLDEQIRVLQDEIHFLNRTKKTRWFHRR